MPDATAVPTVCPPTFGELEALDAVSQDASEPRMLTLGVPDTDYRLKLMLEGDLPSGVGLGDRVGGTLHAEALRVDVISAGGRYVEPVFGRPRRVQGTVVGGDLSGNALFVKAGAATLSCRLTDNRQSLADFSLHQMVSFDVKRGASFRPMSGV